MLIGIGAFILAAQRVPDLGRLIPLLIGIFLLALFTARRTYGLLVAGCIVGGVGLGVALAGTTGGQEGGGIVVLCLGLGFLAILLVGSLMRLPERHWWPLIPGGILTIVGGFLLAGEQGEEALRWWPAILVVIGLAVVARALARPRG